MIRHFRRKSIFILSLLYLGAVTYGQDSTIGHINISSPTAAALGKYGDIPVSYNTGIPNISIPIYTVESGSLKLPISLSYHAGGLKVQEQASWVGAGWSLNAGGVITRAVVGAPDDRGLNAAMTSSGYFSDYGINSYIFSYGGTPCGGSNAPCPIGGSFAANDKSIESGIKDGEPDMYNFNFNGYAGKFYFNDDRTPIIVPETDLKIKVVYPFTQSQNSTVGILGFTITTPDGVIYTFGKNTESDGNIDATEVTTYMTSKVASLTGQGATSSWFLNKISSADGMDSVNLVYQSDKFSYYGLSMYPVVPNGITGIFSNTYEYDLVKNFTNGVRLSKIVFPNGEVDFSNGVIRTDVGDYNNQIISDIANTQSTSLGGISIKNNNGYCKKDSFYYSFTHDATSPLNGFIHNVSPINAITSDSYRLKLDSMQELSCDSTIKLPPYRFTYYPGLVPRKLTFGIDHWGFYNGVTTNQSLIPTFTIVPPAGTPGDVLTYSGADRDTHWPNSQNGVLQQITYPLGGYTNFVYESNDTYTSVTTTTKSNITSGSAGHQGNNDNNVSGFFYTDASNNTYQLQVTSAGSDVNLSGGISGTANPSNPSNTSYITLPPSSKINWTLSTSGGLGGGDFSINEYIPTTVAQNVPVGGLRIKTLTSNDGITSTNIIKNYTYNYGGTQTSGILYSRPVYAQVTRNDIFKQVGFSDASSIGCSANGCALCDNSPQQFYYKSPSSIRPMETVQGNHVGYNQVQVTESGNGYSIYRYYGSNVWDNNTSDVAVRTFSVIGCDPTVPNYPAAPLPFDYLRGELKYEGHFNEGGQILKDAWYFPKFLQDSIFTPGLIVKTVSTSTGSWVLWTTEYNLRSAVKVQDSVVATSYDPANSNYVTTTNVTNYNSPFHHQPSNKFTYNSTGDVISSNLQYAKDYRIPICDTISTGWTSYNTSYQQDSHIFDSTVNYCTTTGLWSCKWLAYQQRRFNFSVDRQKYISTSVANYSDTGKFGTCLLNTLKNNSDTILKPILRLQNSFSNPVIESSQFRNSSFLHSYFVRYDTSLNPIGYAYPGRQKLIDLSTPSGTFIKSAVSGTTITKDSRYVDETFYTFTKGNVVQTLGKDGMAVSYVWDYLNTSPVAKVTNAISGDMAFTSFEAEGGGNWTIPSSARDASSITGTKSYNLSNGAVTKSNLVNGKVYAVSYWSKSGSYTISGGTNTVRTGRTVSPWTYYEHTVTMSSTTLSISGANDIDELRLYPQGAQMTSYTYSPVVGMTTMDDPSGEITYYEYDVLSRLKNIKDYQGSIIKNYQYNYKQGCTTCGLTMQTFAGTPTISYPVGVFAVDNTLIGTATTQAQYVTLWNSNASDHAVGTLSAGSDSMHFSIVLNSGQTNPSNVIGCRYYQYDFNYSSLDGILKRNGVCVDFGDGSVLFLGKTPTDTLSIVFGTNTVANRTFGGGSLLYAYFEHTYADTSQKTITIYHNDAQEYVGLDNALNPATSLTYLKNVRGNFPQNLTTLGASSYQQSSGLSVANINNWNSISTVTYWTLNTGDGGTTPCKNIGYAQDFMINNKNLNYIKTALNPQYISYYDATFKLSKLKTNWNTYFTNLQTIYICDEHWNRENLSALTKLNLFVLICGNSNHSNNPSGNTYTQIPSSVIDNVINQIASGAGQSVLNGTISIVSAGGLRTTASDNSVTALKAKGWSIYIDGILN